MCNQEEMSARLSAIRRLQAENGRLQTILARIDGEAAFLATGSWNEAGQRGIATIRAYVRAARASAEAIQENVRLRNILQRIVDNEKRLDSQVAIHDSLRAKHEALADALDELREMRN